MSYESVVASLSPKLFYKLDETSGTVATDSGSLGVNGTYTNGPTLNQAALYTGGKSVSFDGSNDYVTVTTSAPGSWTAITMCAWVKPATANDKWICNLAYNGGAIPLALGLGNGGDGNGSRWNAGKYNSGWTINTDDRNIVSGRTYFVAATIVNSGLLKLYVDGEVRYIQNAGTLGTWTTNEIRMGRRWDSASYSSMNLAGVAIWDSALTDAQIKSLYDTQALSSYTSVEGEQMPMSGPDFMPVGEQSGTTTTVPTEGQLWPRGNRGV